MVGEFLENCFTGGWQVPGELFHWWLVSSWRTVSLVVGEFLENCFTGGWQVPGELLR